MFSVWLTVKDKYVVYNGRQISRNSFTLIYAHSAVYYLHTHTPHTHTHTLTTNTHTHTHAHTHTQACTCCLWFMNLM